ncbi:Uncharacterized protein LSUE1_G010071 [Lachnellula suecica]|uniref:Flavoprotein domain-containing protein n=1 Tax=Lachnellula suecica TaxID=602035 RepID=A0A8T9BWS6_9HELO|nr:Uncharacterized protein LSUE1_G010071 [Lachnellula suecica]
MASQKVKDLQAKFDAAEERTSKLFRESAYAGPLDDYLASRIEEEAIHAELKAARREAKKEADQRKAEAEAQRKSDLKRKPKKAPKAADKKVVKAEAESSNTMMSLADIPVWAPEDSHDTKARIIADNQAAKSTAVTQVHVPIQAGAILISAYNRTTLHDVKALQQQDGIRMHWRIWDFKDQRWRLLNQRGQQTSNPAHEALWIYVQKLADVIYFCTHQCEVEEVMKYMPLEMDLKLFNAFSPQPCAGRLKDKKSRLHNEMLTTRVQRRILPRWEEEDAYPSLPYDAENDTDTRKSQRLAFFEEQAANDPDALLLFLGTMKEVIDWDKITDKETPEDVAAWQWAVKSLAEACNLVHELGNDKKGGNQKSGDIARSMLRNKRWEEFAIATGSGAPDHGTIAIMILPTNGTLPTPPIDRQHTMAEHLHSLRPRLLQSISKPSSSSSSIADMRVTESPKLRVLIASNGHKDVAQAQALVVRLSKNPNIETRAIVDEDSPYSTNRLSQETLTFKNKSFGPPKEKDEVLKEVERSQIDWYRQQAYELCDWADMLVLAPIDADTFAKMLHGITDSFLLEILRGWDASKKILLVPGMTTSMWENPMTKKQLSKVRRKWQWVRVLQPILWHYENEGTPSKCFVSWDGFSELIDVIKNQAELLTIGHDVDIATSAAAHSRYNTKTDKLLPPELWSTIFEYVGDWEIAKALEVYTTLPTPTEWQQNLNGPKDELHAYMRSLEWIILTSPVRQIVQKLKEAPEEMRYLSSLCVKLIIKFCLTDILTWLETNQKEIFLASFGQKLLPTKASAVYGRTEILEWWRTSPTFLSKAYTSEAIDGASKSGFVHILDWWRKSGLDLKYTDLALEQASSKGHILVLEWWKQASLHQGSYYVDAEVRHRHHSPSPAEDEDGATDLHPPILLKPGKSLLAAAQNNQPLVLRWWDSSGIPIGHSESVAKIASAQGHVDVLDAWRELRGDKMAFDNRILIEPTKNGHVEVLEWWKQFNRAQEGRAGPRAEYKTCDIEEALEDSVGSEGEAFAVKKWWAQNGLNLGVQVREWTRVKSL